MSGDVFKIEEVDSSTGDNLEFRASGDGTAYLVIENPWAGDTYSGFGREGSFTITKAQALALSDALRDWAEGLA